MIRARVYLVLLLSWPALRAGAQTPEPDLTAVKAKTDLSEEDRSAIRAFVSKRVDALRAKDEAAAQQNAADLRSTADGTDAFKKAYAAVCVEAIGAAYKQAEVTSAARLLTLLNGLNSTEALPILLEALQDDRVGVRAAAALGLRALREKLAAAGRDTYQKALSALKEAGKREKSRSTLTLVYTAMNYAELSAGADAKATAAALLDVLEERARQQVAGNITAAGADDAALRVLKNLAGSLEEADKKRLTAAVATLLQHAIDAYTAGKPRLAAVRERDGSREPVERRNATERLIQSGEELLATLLKPDKAPAVTDNLRKLNTVGMRGEWEKWVGLLQKAVGQDFSLSETTDEAESP